MSNLQSLSTYFQQVVLILKLELVELAQLAAQNDLSQEDLRRRESVTLALAKMKLARQLIHDAQYLDDLKNMSRVKVNLEWANELDAEAKKLLDSKLVPPKVVCPLVRKGVLLPDDLPVPELASSALPQADAGAPVLAKHTGKHARTEDKPDDAPKNARVQEGTDDKRVTVRTFAY